MRYIVTTGNTYTDIDGLACVLAYTQLLIHEGKDAIAWIPGVLNHSIPDTVSTWGVDYQTHYTPEESDRFVVMDVSDDVYLRKFLDDNKIVELYDHHFGFESYWKSHLGDRSHIEPVGSCTTLIVEQWKRRIPHIAPTSAIANLVALSTVSNTLNFRASVTTERDREALQFVELYITLGANWIAIFFETQDQQTLFDLSRALKHDTKMITLGSLPHPLAISQLELWNGKEILTTCIAEISQFADSVGSPYYLLTVPSIKEGINYLFCPDLTVQNMLKTSIGAIFRGNIGTTSKLYLRKEILREIQ